MRKHACALFVYGTLKRGFRNHYLIEHGLYVSDKSISGFDMIQLDYADFPALLPGGNGDIHGEVFLIDDETLRTTDRLEGHPNIYLRVKVGVIIYDGVDYDLFTYTMTRERIGDQKVKKIKSGNFK